MDSTNSENMDVADESNNRSPALRALVQTLHWGHLCPSAPGIMILFKMLSTLNVSHVDSLASYPFKDDDPFIIPIAPSIYFAGNQV